MATLTIPVTFHVAPAVPRRASRRLLTVLATVTAAFVAWVIADPLLGVEFAVRFGSATTGDRSVGPGAVVAVSIVAATAGWLLLAALEQFTSHARTVWSIAALAVLALSAVGPAGGAGTASKMALAGMHLLVAAVLIRGMRRSSGRQ